MLRRADNAYVLLTLTMLFWAGNAIAGKLAAGVIPPFTLTAARWTLTALVLYVLARPLLAGQWPAIRKNWRFLFLLGAIGFACFNFGLYGALNFTSAINVTIEQSAMPMIILAAMYFVYREPVTLLQAGGVVVSISGVIVTATEGAPLRLVTLDVNIGDLIMIGAVLAYSAYSVALKKKPNLPWQVMMFMLAASAAIVSIPFAAGEMALGHLPAIGWASLALLFYVVVFPSLLAQVFFIRGVELIGAGRAGLFINLVPVFGAILAVTILGERFEGFHLAGLCLVIGGIGLAEISGRRLRMTQPSGN